MKPWLTVPLAALLGSLSLTAAASAQEFANVPGLQEGLSLLRAQAQAQRLMTPARPAARPQPPQARQRVMGAGRAAAEDVFSADAAPDVSAYPVRGMDISHYEGAIAWDLVKLDGLSFVYIKATEGGDGVDAKFADNWQGATSAGLLKGAYHFYNFCKDGAVQADNFIKMVPPDADALPMTIDLEQSGDCKTMPQKDAFRADLAVFVQKMQDAYGHRPVLYLDYSIYDAYFKGENDAYKLWVADISHQTPALSDGSAWTMWQYGWHGHLPGIPSEVDLDVFNGTPQMLAALTGPSDAMLASLR
jgi:lysozyme